jgi:GNAT superfamily N-acetyltransferase
MKVEITPFRPEHASRIAELNRESLDTYSLTEPAEDKQLADPHGHFTDGGGQIFVAVHEADANGTCAALPRSVDELGLAKLTVALAFRGHGIARCLIVRCVPYARERGVCRGMLVSNSQLRAALQLYQSLGFRFRPTPAATKYAVADAGTVMHVNTAHSPG